MTDLAKLLEHPGIWRGNELARVHSRSVPTGSDRLDRELPGGGWPTGALTEILIEQHGIGELSLLLPALASLAATRRWQALIAPPHQPYAPALVAAGIDLERLIVVHPKGHQEAHDASLKSQREALRQTLWSIEQTLRTNVCGAVLAWLPAPYPAGRLARGSTDINYAMLRRLQLAAEASEVFVAVFRPAQAANEASPAALRIAVVPATQGRVAVHLLKRRGLAAEAPVLIDLKRSYAVDRHQSAPTAAGSVPARRLGSHMLN